MSNRKNHLITIFSRIEDPLDMLRLQLKLRRGKLEPLMIQPYRGHGTQHSFYLKGRVLERSGVTRSSSTDSAWQNMVNMYRRFTSNEMRGARVRARIGDAEWKATADREGYFSLHLDLPPSFNVRRIWNTVKLDLLEPIIEHHPPVRTVGHVLVPSSGATFAIISDIDDTVLKTDATSLLRMARIVLLTNAHTRVPFEGVAAFYRALRRGGTGCEQNPIFYVSSGPWNLYDLLIDFMNIHGIPYGPLFLRDFGFDAELLSEEGHHKHKLEQIERLIETYSDLQFVLIGDSGQEDPEIYQQVVHDYPGRIKAIYIRDVTTPERRAQVQQIADELETQGVEMQLVCDTWEAAKHAVDRGLIAPDALPKIRANKEEDERMPEFAVPALGNIAPASLS